MNTKRKVIKLSALWLMGSGILAFIVGALLGGMDGDRAGIYWGESGLILIAIGIGMLVWSIIAALRGTE